MAQASGACIGGAETGAAAIGAADETAGAAAAGVGGDFAKSRIWAISAVAPAGTVPLLTKSRMLASSSRLACMTAWA